MAPIFLGVEAVYEIQRDQVRRYGGSEGVRDVGLLESALAMPKASFGGHYLHEDLFEMAAAYLYHIVQNHPFVDANKRAGLVAAVTFLDLNGTEVTADEDEAADLVLEVAQGMSNKAAIAWFLRENSTPNPRRDEIVHIEGKRMLM
jgi:death on curing protein